MGFTDPDWEGPFYSRGLKSGEHLPFYARFFDTVELDTTFHAEPTPDRVQRWADAVPAHFRFCVKTPKQITHELGLQAGLAPMRRFLDVLDGFGSKLGIVLVQFPPSFTASAFDLLQTFLQALPGQRPPLAIEFRHGSWNTHRTESLLRDHACAFVAADYLDEPWPIRVTSDHLYVRWIGRHNQYATHTAEQTDMTDRLEWWKRQIEGAHPPPKTVWGMFNNDYAGYSIGTCNRFRKILGLDVATPTAADRGELFA